jgi:hypothetical protein
MQERPRQPSFFPFQFDGLQRKIKDIGNKLLDILHIGNNDQDQP